MNLISTFLPIFVVSVSLCEWLLQSVSSVLTLFINKWESEVNQIGFCRCISRKEWYQTLFSQKRKLLHFMEWCTHVIWSKILCFINIVFGKLYRRNKCPYVYILLERFSNKHFPWFKFKKTNVNISVSYGGLFQPSELKLFFNKLSQQFNLFMSTCNINCVGMRDNYADNLKCEVIYWLTTYVDMLNNYFDM